MGEKLGVRLPVVPMKGQIVHVTLPAGSPMLSGASGPGDSNAWPIVSADLQLLPGAVARWTGGVRGYLRGDVGYDTRPTAVGMRDLLRECVTVAPGLADATFTEVRVGCVR